MIKSGSGECKRNGNVADGNNFVCSVSIDRNPCNEDSGGPLVINGIIVGIVSGGVVGCNSNFGLTIFDNTFGKASPPSYTKVATFVTWIEETSADGNC